MVAKKRRLDVGKEEPALEAAARICTQTLVQPLHPDANVGVGLRGVDALHIMCHIVSGVTEQAKQFVSDKNRGTAV